MRAIVAQQGSSARAFLSYSFSEDRASACSHHGGVAVSLNH
jgi:hypothetical protein